MSEWKSALIVEDEPIIGFALEDMLLEIGFEDVILATTLEAARQYLATSIPQTAILDVNIHGQRSYALADELILAQVPFVFATGYGDAEHPARLKAVPTLTKPYNMIELRRALAEAARFV